MLQDWALASRSGLIVVDADQKVRWFNPAAAEYWTDGFPIESALGDLHADWPAHVEAGDVSFACRVGEHDLRVTLERFQIEEEQWMALRLEEPTEKGSLEQELLHLASFPELAPHPVFEVDLNGDVVYANDAGTALLDELDLPALLRDVDSGTREVRVGDRYFQFTIHQVTEYRCHRVYAQDITEQILSARSLIAARDQLEQRVEERTAALTEQVKQTEAAEERAKQASRAKSAFLANMSHELRTPLNAIIGYGELLLEESAGTGFGEDLGRINGAAQHLLGMISDILDLSKIEAGQMDLYWEWTDPAALVEQIVDAGGGLVGTNRLVVHNKRGLPSIRCDRAKFRQIGLNLLGNAAKFTANGTIAIRLSANGRRVLLEVEDTGIGIPADRLEQIFDPFTQADDGTARQFGGTGLGMSISTRLAEAMGGGLTATSEVGVGSCFKFWLPIQT